MLKYASCALFLGKAPFLVTQSKNQCPALACQRSVVSSLRWMYGVTPVCYCLVDLSVYVSLSVLASLWSSHAHKYRHETFVGA